MAAARKWMLVLATLAGLTLAQIPRRVWAVQEVVVLDKAKELERILDKVEERNRSLKTLSADIETVREIKLLDVKERSSGVVYFKKPNLVRLEIKKPRTKVTVCDGKYVWIFEPALEQVQKIRVRKNPRQKELSIMSFGFTRSVKDLEKDFDLVFLKKELHPEKKNSKGEIVEKRKIVDIVQMTRKKEKGEENADDKKMIVYVVEDLWVPERIDEYESDGEIVTRTFLSKIKVNPKLSKKLFRFKVPKGIDVVEPFGE